MAKIHSIKPFPADIDRDYFGAWLSGFTDGEGSFGLNQFLHGKKRYLISRADFFIGLRADDDTVLRLIQSYWQCGDIHWAKRRKFPVNAKPSINLRVHRANDLAKIVVPHFEKFPLLAKKRRDFEIWKQGAMLQYEVKSRKKKPLAVGKGTQPQWRKEEIEFFAELAKAIREVRKYNSDLVATPTKKVVKSPYRELF